MFTSNRFGGLRGPSYFGQQSGKKWTDNVQQNTPTHYQIYQIVHDLLDLLDPEATDFAGL